MPEPTEGFWQQFTPTTYGVIAFIMLTVGTLIKTWPAIKAAVTAARTADRTAEGTLLDRYEDRFKYLEEAERRCQQELAAVTRRLAMLEGYDEGQGRARQEAQRMISSEREADRYTKPKDS